MTFTKIIFKILRKMTKTTNENLLGLVKELKKASHSEAAIWGRIADDLSAAVSRKRAVNLSRLNHFTKDNEVVVVPGKVLGGGDLDHKLTIAAFAFSRSAEEAIQKSKGKAITIKELFAQNPKGKGVRIIG